MSFLTLGGMLQVSQGSSPDNLKTFCIQNKYKCPPDQPLQLFVNNGAKLCNIVQSLGNPFCDIIIPQHHRQMTLVQSRVFCSAT